MPGPLGLATRPGINRAGTGLPMAGLSVPMKPRLSRVFACPGWVIDQVLLLTAAPCSVTEGALSRNGLLPCLPHLTTASPRGEPAQVWSWCDRTPPAPRRGRFGPNPP